MSIQRLLGVVSLVGVALGGISNAESLDAATKKLEAEVMCQAMPWSCGKIERWDGLPLPFLVQQDERLEAIERGTREERAILTGCKFQYGLENIRDLDAGQRRELVACVQRIRAIAKEYR